MLEVHDLAATYPGAAQPAIQGVNLTVAAGELVAVVGRSGSGKSTLLKVLAGYLPASAGQVLLDGQPVTKPGFERGVVFQNASLYPWLNVEQNIAFGLKMRHLDPATIRSRVATALDQIDLQAVRRARVSALSGGMKQRVALARVLVNQPRLALLDESFGALDPHTRAEMHQMVLRLWQEQHSAFFIITHDIDEALFLGQKIAVMQPGTLTAVRANPYFGRRDRDAGYAQLKADLVASLDS